MVKKITKSLLPDNWLNKPLNKKELKSVKALQSPDTKIVSLDSYTDKNGIATEEWRAHISSQLAKMLCLLRDINNTLVKNKVNKKNKR